MNLAGYVSQPVQLVTTLSALPALENQRYFSGDLHAADPISVIRVRVAGVSGPDAVSLARIRQVAQQIAVRTHLTVDIVAGSSPRPTTVDLPAGRFGQPGLRLTEGWVHKGVAVAILTAVDRKSVVLFTLILIVCVLFVANSATAAVRAGGGRWGYWPAWAGPGRGCSRRCWASWPGSAWPPGCWAGRWPCPSRPGWACTRPWPGRPWPCRWRWP